MAGISISMSCPNCGGTLAVKEGAEMTSCPFCSALLAIEGDDGIRQIIFKNEVTGEKAVDAVRSWWLGPFTAYDLKRKARITESFLIYMPFWKLHAMAAGWVCGYRITKGKNRRRVNMEEMVLEDSEWTCVACDAGDIGVIRLRNLEGETLPYDTGQYPAFEITTSRTDALAIGSKQIKEDAVKAAGVPNVTFRQVDAFPGDVSVIFYPLWVVRYAYDDRLYFAAVDGVTGEVLAGRAPGSTLMRSLALALGMATGALGPLLCIWFTLEFFNVFTTARISSRGMGDMFYLILLADITVIPLCLAIAAGTYAFFRNGAELTTGDTKGGYDMIRSTQQAMDRMRNRIRLREVSDSDAGGEQ